MLPKARRVVVAHSAHSVQRRAVGVDGDRRCRGRRPAGAARAGVERLVNEEVAVAADDLAAQGAGVDGTVHRLLSTNK